MIGRRSERSEESVFVGVQENSRFLVASGSSE